MCDANAHLFHSCDAQYQKKLFTLGLHVDIIIRFDLYVSMKYTEREIQDMTFIIIQTIHSAGSSEIVAVARAEDFLKSVRKKRTHFTDYQRKKLEEAFAQAHYIAHNVRGELAAKLNLREDAVQVSFRQSLHHGFLVFAGFEKERRHKTLRLQRFYLFRDAEHQLFIPPTLPFPSVNISLAD